MPATTPIWELPEEERSVEGLDGHGEPDPAYAAALGLLSAPLGRRAAAAGLDLALVLLLQVPMAVWSVPLFWRLLTDRITWYGFVEHPDMVVSSVVAGVTLLLTVLLLVAQVVTHGRWGFTLGRLALGLRTVDVATLDRPGVGRAFLRGLVVWLPVVTVIGTPLVMLSTLWAREDRWRGWQDRVGHTWAIDVRRGLNPYDRKRMRIARKTVVSTPAPSIRSLPSLATTAVDDPLPTYRPGARTGAGVLGVARPHPPGERATVGLMGLDPGRPAPAPDTVGVPHLGGYVSAARPTSGGAASPATPAPAASAPVPAAPMPAAPVPAAPVPAAPVPAAPVPAAPEPVVRDTEPPPGERPAGRRIAGRTPVPAPGSASPAAPTPDAPSLALLFESGHRIPLSGPVVLGRAPARVDDALPVAIADPESSISKTHVLLRPSVAGIQVLDQGSTNGTAVVHDGHERACVHGEPLVAVVGDTIRIGDRTAQVLGS